VDGWLEGAIDLVVEVHSPKDEAHEKQPFYEKLGVRESLIVDRITKSLEMRRLGADGRYAIVAPDAEGWIAVECLAVHLKTGLVSGRPEVLIRDDGTGEVTDTAPPV
jgi:Uma2 family endonuclease